ncbi:MAG: lipase, partial [Actinomycetota bacterium]|nr:lipase [Actinomycetota bacterium]
GASRARRVVTLGSPHHGSDVASLGSVLSGASCREACQELAPGSALLGRLNRDDETPPGPRWISIWTRDDQVVSPPSSARLSGALDISLQDLCPGRRVAHGQLPSDAAVQALVLDAIAVELPTRPQRCPVS